MNRQIVAKAVPVALASMLCAAVTAGEAAAAPSCSVSQSAPVAGMQAAASPDGATISWSGTADQRLELQLRIVNRAPVIARLAIRGSDGSSRVVLTDAKPDYQVVTGLRRISNQQLVPLRALKVPLNQQTIDRHRWDPFWDAPLHIAAPRATTGMGGNPPPAAGIEGTDQPGLPRRESEIQRAGPAWDVQGCEVRVEGPRAVVTFPGVKLGVFSGSLQYTLWRGTNLIRMEIVARTQVPWVAYKYDAGLQGLRIDSTSRVAWRDTSGTWQQELLGGAAHADPVPLQAANRVIAAEAGAGSAVAVFPPPHRYFWARELATNRAYSWFRKDAQDRYALGIRQAESESEEEFAENWALYSARPGTEQLMPVYLFPSVGSGAQAIEQAMAFTRGDRFRSLPGYKVMNHHYHMDLGERLLESGSLATRLPDLVALRAVGLDIVSQIDSVFLGARAARPGAPAQERDELAIRKASIEGARLHSDRNFLVLANQEVYNSPIGGHTDLLFSHPVYWDTKKPGEKFEDSDPRYGKVYRLETADELMKMVRAESAIISMPHPRTKGSTGFPDAIQDEAFFQDRAYNGVGVRWGMGLDGSERRTCELRCLSLVDDMSNWMSRRNLPLKYMTSISEVRHQQPGDDIYSSAPVTYVELDELPPPEDVSPLIRALTEGRSFVTTGEVLLHSTLIEGSGRQSTFVADVEWTFPLEFVEIVWGDGTTTGRRIVPAADLPPFGRHRFEIPFDARGQRWVRFAAWDSAYEGAMTHPVKVR